MDGIEAQIAALPRLSAHELRITWRRLGRGEATVEASRDLLIREIAFKMQERAHGGLTPAVRRRLRALAEEIDTKGGGALAPPIVLKPGTRVMREWGGRTHSVVVLDNGFEYDGQHHRSLTRIAQRITGAHWSGPRFFGLRKTAAQSADATGAGHE
jgi:hypothetical protein